MKFRRRIFVVGGAHTTYIGKYHPDFIWKKHPDFGKRDNPTLEEHLATAVRGALEKTGVDPDAIQKGYVGNFAGQLFVNQGHLGAMLGRIDPKFNHKPIGRTEAACASGGIAITASIDALNAGYDVALAAGAEVQTSVSARTGADYLARASHYATERSIDEFTFPCMFARRAKHYKEAFGVTDEEIAHAVVKAYSNANKNPFAHMRAVSMTLERASAAGPNNPNFLKNEDYRDHLKISDCSQVSDGASALILATEEGLNTLGIAPEDCIEILSYGHTTSALGQVEDYTRLTNAAAAAAVAYQDAEIEANAIQIAEVHDCFAVTELMMMEALGFAKAGQAAAMVKDGATAIDGTLPINTGGGLMAFGHPVGATGIKQALEIYRQMKQQCGDYQVPQALNYGLTANMGGDDRTTVVMTYRNVQ